MNKSLLTIIIVTLCATTTSLLATFLFFKYYVRQKAELIEEFYSVENAVHVSPHSLRKAMDEGGENYILVDLRSEEEYEEEHIIGAVNIPAYKDRDTSAYWDKQRIIQSFQALQSEYPEKNIIVYCYSAVCMTGRKIWGMLAENHIYVKHLGIGWNEWKYDWKSRNHPHEWEITNSSEYISSGAEPWVPTIKTQSTACPIDNEFGC